MCVRERDGTRARVTRIPRSNDSGGVAGENAPTAPPRASRGKGGHAARVSLDDADRSRRVALSSVPELDGAVVTGGRRQGHRRDDLVDDGRYKGDALLPWAWRTTDNRVHVAESQISTEPSRRAQNTCELRGMNVMAVTGAL